MSFGFSGATDRDRYRFLSGFKLNDQGKNEDPTYLGFSVDFVFDDGPGIDSDYGTPISPLFREGNYSPIAGPNIFGQDQYQFRTGEVLFYSAQRYLENREQRENFTTVGKRSQMLKQFKILLRDITKNQPWFFQSISGLDALYKVARPGFQDQGGSDDFNPSRANTIEIKTLESLNLRMTALADLYNHATFDYVNMRETIPRNLRRFRMNIFVTDLRNFFKTNRLINSSTTLSTIANTANLLGSGINPGNNLAASTLDSTGNFATDSGSGGLLNIGQNALSSEGLSNQQDQTGIKPIIVIQCSNCEFDFTESSPISSDINAGTDAGQPLEQSFKIHVGRVRIRSQYPNIRLDKRQLIISDDVFTEKSSVQAYEGDPSGRTIFGIDVSNGPAGDLLEQGGNAVNNLIGNTVNDLYNRGAQILGDSLSGVDQLLLGNIYSFNPSEIINASDLSLNDIRDFSNQKSSVNISRAEREGLPNPQTMGKGGPPENKYSTRKLGAKGQDEYPRVPGRDLGVTPPGSPTIGRVYDNVGSPSDAYTNVPGKDLGPPGRTYRAPREDDKYKGVPGKDLGGQRRIYKNPTGDSYKGVPGKDLGVPQRVYPTTNEDFYPDVPGKDLGVPQRVYPDIKEDIYPDVPGKDLGVPERRYPLVNDDIYPDVPGKDLGVPERRYPLLNDDIYADVPGKDLGVPGRKYPLVNDNLYRDAIVKSNELKSREIVYKEEIKSKNSGLGDAYTDPKKDLSQFDTKPSPVYPQEKTKYFRGGLGDLYPPTQEDFNPDSPGDLGNLKPKGSYNISLGGKNPDPTKFNS
jgi:hypothetical protein